MNNFLFPYLLIMLHFLSGAFFLILINRKLDSNRSREQWIKFISYVILFNLIWNSKIYSDIAFMMMAHLVMILCSLEWWKAIQKSWNRFWLAAGFILVLAGFWRFLYLPDKEILFTVFIVILFDGSSQIAGQLFGKIPLLPGISPSKTLEGLIGGITVTLGTALLLRNSFLLEWAELILMSMLVILFAFMGDLLASYVKRKAGLVTFSRMLPGHGGFLDRFDSHIMAGGAVFLVSLAKEIIG
ncbi:MAG: phosphatidate cytidylyltransferase [Bacteroidota bacterium]